MKGKHMAEGLSSLSPTGPLVKMCFSGGLPSALDPQTDASGTSGLTSTAPWTSPTGASSALEASIRGVRGA
eukprot:9743490-Alexandrium_andersonii.AAC.1